LNPRDLADSVATVASRIFAHLPDILGPVLLVALGWVVARLLRWLTRHLASRAMERLARTKAVQERVARSTSYQSVPEVSARVVFWTVLLFFLAAAIEALGLPAVSRLVAVATAYLPRILAGILIVFVGLWAGEAVRAVLVRNTRRAGIGQAELLGRAVQVLVLALTFIMAVDQVGINSTVLVIALTIVFAATFGAAALAFGLGARATVSNILAAHYLQKTYHTGDYVRIGPQEGRITEITKTAVVLETEQERTLVPAYRFSEEASILLRDTD
jgi:small-conductance mechanosensitive channel